LTFGYDRLKQTGTVGARKKTANKWFETQDSISYWDDFNQQKIIWKIIGNQMPFSIDLNSHFVNNACYILTGTGLMYLLSVLNSKAIAWYSFITNMNKTGMGDIQVGAQNVNLFPIPVIARIDQQPFIDLMNEILHQKELNRETIESEKTINSLVNELYGLTDDEVAFIEIQ
jgi:adenine-specific DNA-methyltransferase